MKAEKEHTNFSRKSFYHINYSSQFICHYEWRYSLLKRLSIHTSDYLLFFLLGRILYNIPCSVCHDNSSGKHYSVYACDGYVKSSVEKVTDVVLRKDDVVKHRSVFWKDEIAWRHSHLFVFSITMYICVCIHTTC